MRVSPLCSAAALLAAASLAFPPAAALHAQAPGPLPGMTPPPLPAGLPPTGPGGRPSMAGDTVRLQFANTDVRDVLDNYYAPLVGKRVIYDNTLQGQLTVFINTPVAREEAIRILESILMLNQFHIVAGENDIVRILTGAKNPRFYAPPIYSDPAQIPDGDQVISFLIKPRYIDIAELNQVLGQYIQIQKPYTSFIALPKTGAILATEDSPTLRRLLPIIDALDVAPAIVIDKFVKLDRADAAKAVEFVNAVLGRDKSGGAGAAVPGVGGVVNNTPGGGTQRRPIRRLNEEGQPMPDNVPLGLQPSPGLQSAVAALSEGNLTAGSVNIQADIRTNRVHLVARPADFPFLERLIREFDANTPFADPVRRSLRFVTATDMLPILVQSLQEQGAPDAGGQNGANGAANPNRNASNTGNRGSGGFGSGSGTLGGGSSGSNSGSLFGSGSSGGDSSGSSTGGLGTSNLQTREVSDQPLAAVVGTTRLIADPRTNSISILGGAEAREKVDRLLTLLDVPTPQVMIEVLIGELSLTNTEQFGINYLLRTGKNAQITTGGGLVLPGTTTQTTTGTTTTDPTTGVVTTTGGGTVATAVNLAQIATQSVAAATGVGGTLAISKYFAAAVTALENSGRFKTVSRPIIFTSNNKAATILSGQEIAVPTSQYSSLTASATSTGLSTNVQYRRVALQLDVVPLINSANAVTLDIVQQVNNVVPNSGTSVNGTNIPTISTRAVKSTVTVPNQGTVVLGGLITQTENLSRGAVPVLNRIPLLGELFKSHQKDNTRNELIILLRPTITNTAQQLIAKRHDEENHLYLEPGLDEQLRPILKALPVNATTTVKVQPTIQRERPITAK